MSETMEDTTPRCDECGKPDEEVLSWCGNCGCCNEHCQGHEGCAMPTEGFDYLTFDPEWYDSLDDMHACESWRRWVIHSGPVTLDGVKAVIGGVRNDYATVSTLPHGASYEWSWSAVARIMSDGGNFVS